MSDIRKPSPVDRTEARERVRAGFRRWFRAPPRRHGDVIYTREVSFLELFYDLVYVVLIAQVSHHLAEHLGWEGILDFAILFGLIWLAWFNAQFGLAFYEPVLRALVQLFDVARGTTLQEGTP